MNIVLEGGSMIVICVAMGTPMPTVSLYISGVLIRQEKTRHMAGGSPVQRHPIHESHYVLCK